METTDLTIEILQGIRDEIRKTNDEVRKTSDEVRKTSDEVRKTNERMDLGFATLAERIDRVERRQSETEIRLATELVGVAGAVREVRDLLRQDLALRERVDDHERRIVAVEKRPR